ncbi:kinase-like protein, partial [Rhizophagus irregularis]
MNTKNYSYRYYDPRLDSSPVPVLFIPFKNNEKKCSYCGIEYSKTLKFEQKYCKNCLFRYIKYMENDVCLNKYVSTSNTHQCINHKATKNNFCATNIHEWCEHFSEILYFTHLIPNTSSLNNYSELSGGKRYLDTRPEDKTFKLIEYGQKHHYQIYSEWVISILTKKSIQILYLSWWDNFDKCVVCLHELKYIHQEKIGEGGFSIIYKATWSDGIRNTDVALKKLFSSQKIEKNFLNEIKSLSQCDDRFNKHEIIGFHGITQDPVTKKYILIMKYANGNLHNYLQNNFINITWEEKSHILAKIICGLEYIHLNHIIHRDFHSGNILSLDKSQPDGYIDRLWLIGDFGLSQPANSTSPNNEIYG